MNVRTFYLVLCIVFVGRGDKHLNKRTVNKEHRDIGSFNEPIGIESESWSYEDAFDVDKEKDFYSKSSLKLIKFRKRNREALQDLKREMNGYKQSLEKNFVNSIHITDNHIKNKSEDGTVDFLKFKSADKHSNEFRNTMLKWPKFEDLLLSIGVEYDWKSDRWIKIKNKVTKFPYETFNVIHQKHEFKYKTVRINGSKRRKNVIIAVTAVR